MCTYRFVCVYVCKNMNLDPNPFILIHQVLYHNALPGTLICSDIFLVLYSVIYINNELALGELG